MEVNFSGKKEKTFVSESKIKKVDHQPNNVSIVASVPTIVDITTLSP
jgi:hypothetical protein